MSPLNEKMILSCAVIIAFAILLIGVWWAFTTHEPEWLNRAGALIVCTESIVLVAEFLRRSRLQDLQAHNIENPYLESESRRAERHVLVIAISLAIIGEFLHGFGDILMRDILERFFR